MSLSLKTKVNSIGSGAIQVQIDGVDYSIADIIHKELLNVKHVKFAGVSPPHPLIKTMNIQVHVDSGETAADLLEQALTNAEQIVNELLQATRKLFPDAIRVAPIQRAEESPTKTQHEPESEETTRPVAAVASSDREEGEPSMESTEEGSVTKAEQQELQSEAEIAPPSESLPQSGSEPQPEPERTS